MNYVVDASADEPIMLLSQHIGLDTDNVMGVDSSLFQESLLQLDAMGKKSIKIYINSPGGDVDGGMAIYHAILQTKTKVDTYCVFMACSIAAVIFEAGRTRYMADYSLLMFHSPRRKGTDGTDTADPVVDKFRASMVTAIAQRSKQPEEAIDKMLNKDTWIDATTAVATGLADEVQASADYNKKRATVAERSNYIALFSKGDKILNSLITQPQNSMKKITAHFKLNPEANEDAVLECIQAVEKETIEAKAKLKMKADSVDDDTLEMKKKLEAAEKKCADMEAKLKGFEEAAKVKADADEKDKLEAATKKSKDMVAAHDKAGRIKYTAESKDKVIAFYEKQAIVSFDETDAILREMAINKQSTAIPGAGENKDGFDPSKAGSAQAKMLAIQMRQKGEKLV